MTESLPQECQLVIRAYQWLDFGHGRHMVCPYFQNTPRRKRFGAAAEVGKGTAEEIVAETIARATFSWPEYKNAHADEIRAFMIREGIGIDCSGFASRVLDPWIRTATGKSIGQAVRSAGKSWWQKILFFLRPFNNLDVMTLTHPNNCTATALTDLRPGDLIKTRGGKHVLVVSSVLRDAEGILLSFSYVHSSQQFGDEAGVREGIVNIINVHALLEDQDWRETWQGKKPTLEGWKEKRERNGIFRLHQLC